MLGRLIAYEFRASSRLIPLVYAVVGLLVVAGMIFSFFDLPVYYVISFVVLWLAAFAALIITYVVIFIRFYRGMYGSEGYLAMTLPVRPAELYFSKMIVSFCWMLLSAVVMTLAALASIVMIFRWVEGEMPTYLWEEIVDVFSTNYGEILPPGMIPVSIIMGIVGYCSFIAQVYFCITIANVRPFQKLGIGAAIIAYVVMAITVGILSNILTYFVPLSLVYTAGEGWSVVNRSMWSSMFDYAYSYDMNFSIGIAAYLLPVVMAVGLPIITIRLMGRTVNLK